MYTKIQIRLIGNIKQLPRANYNHTINSDWNNNFFPPPKLITAQLVIRLIYFFIPQLTKLQLFISPLSPLFTSPYTGPSWLETRIYELRLKVQVQSVSIYTSHSACVASTPIISLTQSISLRLCVLTCGFWPLTDTHWDTAAPKINHPVLPHSAYPQNTVHSCTYTVIIHDHRWLTHKGTLMLTSYTSSIEFLPLFKWTATGECLFELEGTLNRSEKTRLTTPTEEITFSHSN